jgi:hypothetical protein
MNDKSYIRLETGISCVFIVVSFAISIERGVLRIYYFTCTHRIVRIIVFVVLVTISVALTLLLTGCIFVIADILIVIRLRLRAQAPIIIFILRVFVGGVSSWWCSSAAWVLEVT